jgi:hypothetical protein
MPRLSSEDVREARSAFTAHLQRITGTAISQTVVGEGPCTRLTVFSAKLAELCEADASALSVAGAKDIFQRIIALLEAIAVGITPIILACNAGSDAQFMINAQGRAAPIFAAHDAALEEEEEELSLLVMTLRLRQQRNDLLGAFHNQISPIARAAEGAFGEVHKVIDPADGQPYALKIIRDQPSATGDSLQVGLPDSSESAALRKLTHPYIVRYFMDWLTPPWFVFEWISGGDLLNYLVQAWQSQRIIDQNIVGVVMQQLASALHYMHGKGIIHRDLKLDNVMIADSRHHHIKIIDLGCSCFLNGTGFYVGKRVGYPGNASYEKANNLPFDGRDDTYAVGRIALALLLGEP